ncbi:MAG: hypothetical protein GYA33_15015, partial [Thermogutta sp.]|nr:hypothetical protein [Thermogutta sp.]
MSELPHRDLAVYDALLKALLSLRALGYGPTDTPTDRIALAKCFRELWDDQDRLAVSADPPWRRYPMVEIEGKGLGWWTESALRLVYRATRQLALLGYPRYRQTLEADAAKRAQEWLQGVFKAGPDLNGLSWNVERERDALQRLLGAEAAGTPVQVEIKPDSRPKRRGAGGRPRVSKDEARWRQQVLRDWIEAKSAGVDLKTFANQYS